MQGMRYEADFTPTDRRKGNLTEKSLGGRHQSRRSWEAIMHQSVTIVTWVTGEGGEERPQSKR